MIAAGGVELRWVATHFAPWLAGLNLAWEAAQLPLYTLWNEAGPGRLAFAVLHCTAGDVLIGTSAMFLALILMPRRREGLFLGAMTAMVVAYTAFSEWLNTAVLMNWAYSASMPVAEIGPLRLGLSPLVQAALMPLLAAWLAGVLTLLKSPTAATGRIARA